MGGGVGADGRAVVRLFRMEVRGVPGDTKRSDLSRVYRQVGPYLGLGVQFVASILLFLFLGRWLDTKLGTTPILMLVGVALGTTAGFYHFFRTVMQLQEKDKRDKEGP